MKLGYTIAYVADVEQSLVFFAAAFGLRRRFLHDSGTYGELETGETTLAFTARELAAANVPGGVLAACDSVQPLGIEIALVADDVASAHRSALAHGATELAAPAEKPWGQTVSYLRAPDGLLIELCSSMADE